MLIVLNGYPGVGKLTIGQNLASLLRGRLLDIHSVYNVAFALTEIDSPQFWETIEKVELIAHDLICKLPEDQPVVLTTVLTNEDERERAEWDKIIQLGRARPPFCVVHIACDLDENIRRIQSEERSLKRKPRDPDMARRNQVGAEPLAGLGENCFLSLDTTTQSPEDAANTIFQWASQR